MKRVSSGTGAGNRAEERRECRRLNGRSDKDKTVELKLEGLYCTHTSTRIGTSHIYITVRFFIQSHTTRRHTETDNPRRDALARGSWKRDAIGGRRRGADRRGGTGRVTSMAATRRNPTPRSASSGIRRAERIMNDHRRWFPSSMVPLTANTETAMRLLFDRRLVPPSLPLSWNLAFRSRGRPSR